MTRAEMLATGVASLAGRSPTARLDATRLAEHVLRVRYEQLIADGDAPVTDAERDAFDSFVARRRLGEPVAYLIGEAWFYGRRFAVDESVLVPRPETELLVERVVAHVAARMPARPSVLDVGTGSGAIAVTLACEIANVRVSAIDVSRPALRVARENAVAHGVADRVALIESDLLEGLEQGALFEVVAANLPYVRSAEVPPKPDPLGFEPLLALDGGEDGLDLYRRLLPAVPGVLSSDGFVILEAAPETVDGLRELVSAALPDRLVEIVADYAGLGRFVVAAPPDSCFPRSSDT